MLPENRIGGRIAGGEAAAVEAVSAGAEEEARAQGSRGASSQLTGVSGPRGCEAHRGAVREDPESQGGRSAWRRRGRA